MASIRFSLLVALVAMVVFAFSTEGRLLEKGCRLVPTRKFDRSLLNSTWPTAQIGSPGLGNCESRCAAHGKACKAILFSPRTSSSLATCIIHLQQSWQRTVGYSVRVSEARNRAVTRMVKTCAVERREAVKSNRCFKKVGDFSPFHNLPTQGLHNRDECFTRCQKDLKCLAVALSVGKKQCTTVRKRSYMQFTKKCDARRRCTMVAYDGDDIKSGKISSSLGRSRSGNEQQCRQQCLRNPRCGSVHFNEHQTQARYNTCNFRTTTYYLKKQCQHENRNCRIVHGMPDWSASEQRYTVNARLDNYQSVCGQRCLKDRHCTFIQPRWTRNRITCRIYVRRIVLLNKCQDLGIISRCHLKPVSQNVLWHLPRYIKTQKNLKPQGLEMCKQDCKQLKNRCYAIQYGRQCLIHLLFTLMKNECRMVSSRRVCRLVQMKRTGTDQMKVWPQTQQAKKTYQQCAQFCSRDAKCTGIGYEKTTSMCRVFGIQENIFAFYYKICGTVGQCTLTKITQMPPNMKYLRLRYNYNAATPAMCMALCKRNRLCYMTKVTHNRVTKKTYCYFQQKNNNFRYYAKVLTGASSRLMPTDPLKLFKRHLTVRSYYGSQYTIKKCQKKCQQEATCLAVSHGANGRQRRGVTYYSCVNYYKQEKPRGSNTVSRRRFATDMPYGRNGQYFSWSQLKNLTQGSGPETTNNEMNNRQTFYGKLCDGEDKTSCIIRKMNSTDLGFKYPGEFNSYAQGGYQMNMTTGACVKKCKDASWCVGVTVTKIQTGRPHPMMEMSLRRKRGHGGGNMRVYCRFFHFVNMYKKTCAAIPKTRSRTGSPSVDTTLLQRRVPY